MPVSDREELWNALLDTRGASADESDEELASRDSGGEVLGEISRSDWYGVMAWRPELLVRVLEAAESGGALAVADLLDGNGVRLIRRPPPTDWINATLHQTFRQE